jgi:hypothetical protein
VASRPQRVISRWRRGNNQTQRGLGRRHCGLAKRGGPSRLVPLPGRARTSPRIGWPHPVAPSPRTSPPVPLSAAAERGNVYGRTRFTPPAPRPARVATGQPHRFSARETLVR